MNKEQFVEKYCLACGSQRCEGIDSEWGEGCQYRWNLDGMDPAAEIKRLNEVIMKLSTKLMKLDKSRCKKCVHEVVCHCENDMDGNCPNYKRDPKDGGYYG